MEGREEFVARFTAGWAGGREALAAEMEGHVAEDVLLTQPLLPPARGLAGFRAQFERLFRAVPDLTGEVHAWGPTDDGVLIDMTFQGTLGGRRFEVPNCDRIVLRDGLLAERHARFDPLPLLAIAAKRPWAAAPLLRAVRRRPRVAIARKSVARAAELR